MNLENLLILPGSYTKKDKVSLEDFLTLKKEEKLEYSAERDGEYFKFKSSFMKREDNWGFTAAYDEKEDKLYLLKTKVDYEIEELQPKFLIGESTSLKVKNSYLNFFLDTFREGVTYFNFELLDENTWLFVDAEAEVKDKEEEPTKSKVETSFLLDSLDSEPKSKGLSNLAQLLEEN